MHLYLLFVEFEFSIIKNIILFKKACYQIPKELSTSSLMEVSQLWVAYVRPTSSAYEKQRSSQSSLTNRLIGKHQSPVLWD